MLWGQAVDGRPDFGCLSGATILEQAPPTLQEVRVPIFRHKTSAGEPRRPSEIIDADGLPAVESVLALPAFSSLRAFVFELTKKEEIDLYGPLLRHAFPALQRRGLLRVEYLVSVARVGYVKTTALMPSL